MSKFRFLFIGLLLMAASLFATVPAAVGTGATPDVKFVSAVTFRDTLSGSDSSVLISSLSPDFPWEHILVCKPATGVDSVKYYVYVYAYDRAGAFLTKTKVDSVQSQAGQTIFLPIGQTIFGATFKVMLITMANNGSKTIVNSFERYKRRAAVYGLFK